MKSAILFTCHFINDFSIEQYKRMLINLNTDLFDIYYCTSEQDTNKITTHSDILKNIIQYKNDIVTVEYWLDPFRILLEKIENFSNYKYVYVVEYDVYSSFEWNTLFTRLENESEASLLCEYIKKYEFGEATGWQWTNDYFNKHKDNTDGLDINIQYYLKSCLSFFRISVDAIKFIKNYNNGDIKSYIYEMYVPTILYNNGFEVKSLSSIKSEDDIEFYYSQYILPDYFYYTKNYDDYEEMDNIANGRELLFTTYKCQKLKPLINRKFTGDVMMSIVVPVYNAENFLKEAIDSALNQIDAPSYELILVNDGSTDESKNIIQSYNNDKIVYIEKEHSGIVDTLNMGIANAKGKYIVRFDSDDKMYNNRLRIQYDYMENNPQIDICGFGFEWGNGKIEPEYFEYSTNYISLDQLKNNNCIGHPTVIMRKASLDALPYLYESYFEKCEDYKLWCTAASKGLHIASNPTAVIWYRQHDNQVTNSNASVMWKNTERIKKAYQSHDAVMNGEITIIIPFKNEGYEIEKTVCSVRGTTTNLPIILINDGSEDGYDYKQIADFWNCKYVENAISKGVAQSRDMGVELAETEYFVLLDGHMRFYEDNWDVRLLQMLKENPKAILSAETGVISRITEFGYTKYFNEAGESSNAGGAGAYINFDEPGWEFTGKWTHLRIPGYEDKTLLPTSCLMGACYCSNKTWWKHIGGLHGLIMWGQDEPLISIKTWLAGGEILLIKDLIAGHIYRGKAPYSFPANKIYSNSIMMNHLFTLDKSEIEKLDNSLKERINEQCFNEAMNFYKEHETDCEQFKQHFWNDVAIHDLNWFKEFNSKCYVHPKNNE